MIAWVIDNAFGLAYFATITALVVWCLCRN